MARIERKILGTGEFKFPDTVVQGVFRESAVNAALQPRFITFDLNKNVDRRSLQLNTVSIQAGPPTTFRLGFATARTGPLQVFRGVRFLQTHDGSGGFTHFVIDPFKDLRGRIQIANPDFQWIAQGLTNLGQGVFEDPETGNLKLIATIFRPEGHVFFNSILQVVHVYFPGRVELEVTGYELSDFATDSGVDEEKVSCFVEDLNSQQLYGLRPNRREEQSDFIETETQACRVAEAIIWNRNQVLETSWATTFNPSVKRGQTHRVTNLSKGIDILGIIKSVGHQFDINSGSVTTEILMRSTEYIFQSALGEINEGEKLDKRQT